MISHDAADSPMNAEVGLRLGVRSQQRMRLLEMWLVPPDEC